MKKTICILVYCLCIVSAEAAVVEYGTAQRAQWFNDVGGLSNVSVVDFTGYPTGTPISDQWSYLGINFTGTAFTSGQSLFLYPQDGRGIQGYPDINVTFDGPIQWIAADFPGNTTIELYNDDQLIYTSSIMGAGGTGFFGGLISDQPFNRVRFFEEDNDAEFLDNIYFGPPIAVPGPGAIMLFCVLFLIPRKRRR